MPITKQALLIKPLDGRGHRKAAISGASYEFVKTTQCPLGRTECRNTGAFVTMCFKCTDVEHGSLVKAFCICKGGAKVNRNDIIDFKSTIENFAGTTVLAQLFADVREKQY